MNAKHHGAYNADHSLVDFILGITYEIWEEGAIELIEQYYSPETVVYSLDGITHGAAAMIDGTEAMLGAFPDRLLLGDDVIGKGDSHTGYSSHRVLSPMTNAGQSMWGAATGKPVRIMNMADCVVDDAVIVLEWLARDNLALVQQLGFDVHQCAGVVAGNHSDELRGWFASETARLQASAGDCASGDVCGVELSQVLQAQWVSGDAAILDAAYSHYAVLHRSPVEIVSGKAAIESHYAQLRRAFHVDATSIDHVCEQSAGEDADHVATRWTLCGEHVGDFLGVPATGKPVFIMGVTHRRIVNRRIAVEWTVFDSLGVLAQLI